MFKIGNFSKICQVSIKTLRHWDSIDLLNPAHIDPASGYRHYTIDQVADVNRILAFKSMGLSLTQIRKLMAENLSSSEVRGMFRLKKAEIEQQIEQAQLMLAMVEARLHQIGDEGELPQQEVILKPIPAQGTLGLRHVYPDFRALVQAIYAIDEIRTEKQAGPLHALFHDDAFQEQEVDVEMSLPLQKRSTQSLTLPDGTRLEQRELGGVELSACTVHRGSWTTLVEGYTALGRWIDANGYAITGTGREVFHHIGRGAQQAQTVTEIQFPVEKIN